MKAKISQSLFLSLGLISVTLGIIGIFLPILPTTPFAILAAYFFSKSSVRLHTWLLNQKTLGPVIRDWEANGVIRLKAKVLATAMMTVLFSYTLVFVKVSLLIKGFVAFIGLSVLTFIWTRPSQIIEESSELEDERSSGRAHSGS
ncbi:MAG: YbaN family protein [Halobacteriovoraceae bacterium]|nr:YbaN family protein [Halobacteriovoraceae bacterium]